MYRSDYPHWSRDSVSPVCGIFLYVTTCHSLLFEFYSQKLSEVQKRDYHWPKLLVHLVLFNALQVFGVLEIFLLLFFNIHPNCSCISCLIKVELLRLPFYLTLWEIRNHSFISHISKKKKSSSFYISRTTWSICLYWNILIPQF